MEMFDMLDDDLTRPWVWSLCVLSEHSLTPIDDVFEPLYEDNDDHGKTTDQQRLLEQRVQCAVGVSYDLFPDLPASLQSSDELSDGWMENADLAQLLSIAALPHPPATLKSQRPILSQLLLQEQPVPKLEVDDVPSDALLDTAGVHVPTEIKTLRDNTELQSDDDIVSQLVDAPELADVDIVNSLLFNEDVKALLPQDVELQLSPLSSVADYESASPSNSVSPAYDSAQSLDYRTYLSPLQTSSDAASMSGIDSNICCSDSDSDTFKPYSRRKKSSSKSSRVTPKLKVVNITEAELPKKERKKLQNKRAATRYRMKKKGQVDDAFDEQYELEKCNKDLHDKVDQLTREITYMKDLMAEIKKARAQTV